MPENPQPQPGPSPTPTPIPTALIEIGGITLNDGSAIITPSNTSWLEPFTVPQSYIDECAPEVGGFFAILPDVTTYIPASTISGHFPKS